jgi:hypothetical protein
MEVSGQLNASAALPVSRGSRLQLGKLHSRCGRYGEEKNLLPLIGIESRLLGRPGSSLVAIPTELSRIVSLLGSVLEADKTDRSLGTSK